jgi:hypothetical protein
VRRGIGLSRHSIEPRWCVGNETHRNDARNRRRATAAIMKPRQRVVVAHVGGVDEPQSPAGQNRREGRGKKPDGVDPTSPAQRDILYNRVV